jgi:hypothetical protein
MGNTTYTNVLRVELCGIEIVHNLIGSKEPKGVGQVFEVLDNSEDARKVVGVVAGPWLCAVDTLALEGRIDVKNHVDSSGIEDGGA